jgi:hypothetical protein
MNREVTEPDRDPAAGDVASDRGRRSISGPALNLLLAATSILLTLLALELALRVYHGKLFDFSSQLTPLPNRSENPVAQYDSLLGWVPRPGVHQRAADEHWTVNEAGLRSNGSSLASFDGRPIVVVGDSFTFGDEVRDDETWPARLEALLDVPVLNGGVFAYGVDQAYLRATRLIETHDPAVVLLAFVSDDVSRSELMFYGGWKPYFAYEDGELVLRNVPVPSGAGPAADFAVVRRVLGYSYLCSALFSRIAERWWSIGMATRVHEDGNAIVVDLFERLASLARSRNTDFAVVALASSGRFAGNTRVAGVVEESRRRGIAVVDLVAEVERIPTDSVNVVYLERGHYTPRVNGLVAERIAAFLNERR